jgi:flavin reductase (DIM6/NTAB) family NADH-FMN oxidoreductase RutF
MKKINKLNFKKTLSKFATGITVVATNKKSTLYGKTINSFSSLSLSPSLVLFSLDKNSSKLDIFNSAKLLTINILSKKQKSVSNNFAKQNPDWENIEYYLTKDSIPVLKNCVSNLDCKVVDKISKGDHIIFICKVIKILNNEKLKPLIYFNSKYL